MLEVLIAWSWLPFPGLSMDRGKIFFFFFNKIYREFILIVLIQIQDYRVFAQPHHPFLSRFPGLKSRFSATLTLRLVRFIPQHTHNDLQKKTHHQHHPDNAVTRSAAPGVRARTLCVKGTWDSSSPCGNVTNWVHIQVSVFHFGFDS